MTSAIFLGNIRPAAPQPENVSRIQDVQFFSITSAAFDDLSSLSDALASPSFQDSVLETQRDLYSQHMSGSTSANVYEHPCAPLTKILSSGTFYYATRPQWDLSTRLGKRVGRVGNGMDGFDVRLSCTLAREPMTQCKFHHPGAICLERIHCQILARVQRTSRPG